MAALSIGVLLSWGAPAGAGEGGAAFRTYCAECHGPLADGSGPHAGRLAAQPADLRGLRARYGSPLPWRHFARAIDPPPSQLDAAHGEFCALYLRSAFENAPFAWNIRQGSLFEIFHFLDGVQR